MSIHRLADRIRGWVPRWWAGEGGWLGDALDRLLWPAERLYRGGVFLRNRAYDTGLLRSTASPIPVLSVGNLAVGGAGKTPVSAWVAGRLLERGHRPAIVLRGYAQDEILVHRELNPEVPVFAAVHRAEAVTAAAAQGCGVAVVDDGFQHRSLGRALDVVLVAAESWRSRTRLFPRGPWREAPDALRRAAIVVVTRKSASPETAAAVARDLVDRVPSARIVTCDLVPTRLTSIVSGREHELRWLAGRRVLAVTSLADPGPFADQLRSAGAEVELLAFPDHHPFDDQDVRVMLARRAGRPLLMTRKEAVKLRSRLPAEVPGLVLDQRVDFGTAEESVLAAVLEALSR